MATIFARGANTRGLATLLFLLVLTESASAAKLEGVWETPKSKGFSLEILEHRNLVCGQVTAISGQKVDVSWFVGKRKADAAVVDFTSSFSKTRGRGEAGIRLLNGNLTWHVNKPPPAESWILEETHVRRVPWSKGRRQVLSQWCQAHWQTIDQEATETINLQP